MKKKEFINAIKRHKGKVIDDKLLNVIANDIQGVIVTSLNELEIWNANCTLRVKASRLDDGVGVFPYHNPLHSIKDFKTLDGALNYLEKNNF